MTGAIFDTTSLKIALADQAEIIRSALENKISKNLSGEILHIRSGVLSASIISSIEYRENVVTCVFSSRGVPYAAIQEFGGKTGAHDIVAMKAKALAFNLGGNQEFVKSVHHPGSAIPSGSYLKSSLAAIRDDIETGFKQAVLESLGAE